MADGVHIDECICIGPVIMMKFVCKTTEPHGIPTQDSLNPIMVDGTGMCGGCRVEVGGETKFACVDGPEFDAHQVDFGLLQRRNTSYRAFETRRFQDLESLDAAHHEQLLAPVRGACGGEGEA